ncbi:MAG: amino acid permease [Polyangiaceae bacterium]
MSEPESTRPLEAHHVASVVVGAIVGVGIFFTPASLARALPSSAWILAIWALGGIASVSGALVFADLGSRWPKPGGMYVFLREGFGPRVGPPLAFLYGWTQLLVVQPGSMAVIALILVDTLGLLTGTIPDGPRQIVAIASITLFTVANLLGLKTGGRIQLGMAALKVSALALIVSLGVAFGRASTVAAPRTVIVAEAWWGPSHLGNAFAWTIAGLIPVLFSFGGAYHGTYIAGSVRDPERAVPRGILAGIAVVLVLYLAVNLSFLGILGHDGLARSPSPAAEAAGVAFGHAAEKGLAVVIVLSAAGILNTICLGFPFVIYAMAKDGLFFARAGVLHPKTERPVLAVAAQGAFACLAVVVGGAQVDLLLTGIAFADALFQGAVAVVHLLHRRSPAPQQRFRAPLAASVVFLLLELGLALGCLVNTPKESVVGVGLLLAGVIVYFAWAGRRRAPRKGAAP